MKIIGIVGSRRKGNTYAMVEKAISEMNNAETEIVHLKEDFNLCDGCLTCDGTGTCKFEDYISLLVDKMQKADGFIIGTPTRWNLLSGELKAFFDRLNPLAVPGGLKGKKAIIFAVGQCEGEDIKTIEMAAESVEYFCESAGIDVVDKLIVGECIDPEDFQIKYNEKELLTQMAKKLESSLSNTLY